MGEAGEGGGWKGEDRKTNNHNTPGQVGIRRCYGNIWETGINNPEGSEVKRPCPSPFPACKDSAFS